MGRDTRVQLRQLVCGILVVLAVSASASGAPDAETTGEKKDLEQAVAGLLPETDYSGDLGTRRALTGDWGGVRQDWANRGITFEVEWFQVGQGIVSGGRDTGWAYGTNLDYNLKFDLMRMNAVPGALVTVRGQSRFGSSVNEDTGQLLPANTYSYFPYTSVIDDDVPIAITELNWLQMFSENVGLLLGKITTLASTNEFAGGEGKSQFMNFQFMYSSVVAQVAPYSTLAVGGVWLPSPDVTVSTSLLNTTDASTTSGFGDIGDGTSWSTSVDGRFTLGGLPGGATFGAIYAFDGDFSRIGGINIDPSGGGISIDTTSTTWAFFLSGWQYLFTEDDSAEGLDPSNGTQDLQGLGIFAILGYGDRDANPVTFSIAGGLSGRGSIPGRDADTWGIGYFYNDVQDPSLVALEDLRNSTQGIEAYYNIAIADAAALTLDVQWLRSAVPSVDDAVILGLRLNLRF